MFHKYTTCKVNFCRLCLIILLFEIPVDIAIAQSKSPYGLDDDAWKNNVHIFNPPTDRAYWPEWQRALVEWRKNELKNFDGSNYHKPGYEWVKSCFSTCFFIIQDTKFYNRETGEYLVDDFVDYYTREYGRIDAVIMWHLSPQIGFDDRNQFDFFRAMPGGLGGLKKAVAQFHKRGIRFFVNHNPSNSGGWKNDNLRPESPDDRSGGPVAMANIVRALDADGVFLNTYGFGGALQPELNKIKPGIAIEGETLLKTKQEVESQHMEWFQGIGWIYLPYYPGGVLRNKWLERDHMMHQIHRAGKNHTNELHTAWMNGSGMVIWEDIFGIWNGWCERDKSIWRSIHPILRRYADIFSGEGWIPMQPTLNNDIYANLWEGDGIKIYTYINNASLPQEGDLIQVKHIPANQYFDLIEGKEIFPAIADGKATISGKMLPRGVGGLLIASQDKLGTDFAAFLASQSEIKNRENLLTASSVLPVHLKLVEPTKKYSTLTLPKGMIILKDTVYTQKDSVRTRESGSFDNEKYMGGGTIYRKVSIGKIAVDEKPVTNASFREFLLKSNYQPKCTDNFLRNWVNGNPPVGQENAPVVYVDIDDARAYARWAGKRLPSLEEWQYAMETGKPQYGTTRVWEWNESERYDGRVRFSMLKGGSDWAATGTKFYSTGGPQNPQYSAKYLFMYSGLDRIWTIGFRCVADM